MKREYSQIKGYPQKWRCSICGKEMIDDPGHDATPVFLNTYGAYCCDECYTEHVCKVIGLRKLLGENDLEAALSAISRSDLRDYGRKLKRKPDNELLQMYTAELEKLLGDGDFVEDNFNEYETVTVEKEDSVKERPTDEPPKYLFDGKMNEDSEGNKYFRVTVIKQFICNLNIRAESEEDAATIAYAYCDNSSCDSDMYYYDDEEGRITYYVLNGTAPEKTANPELVARDVISRDDIDDDEYEDAQKNIEELKRYLKSQK